MASAATAAAANVIAAVRNGLAVPAIAEFYGASSVRVQSHLNFSTFSLSRVSYT
jgi:hypothetical protein